MVRNRTETDRCLHLMSKYFSVSSLEEFHVSHSPVLHFDLNEITLVASTSHLVSGPVIQLLESLGAHGALCVVSKVVDRSHLLTLHIF